MKVARVYCVECRQKLCQDCEEDHRTFNVTRGHETVELDNEAFSLQRRVDRMQDDLDHGDGAFTLGQLRVNTVKTGEMN